MAYNADGRAERMDYAGSISWQVRCECNLDLSDDLPDFVAAQETEEIRAERAGRQAREVSWGVRDDGEVYLCWEGA